ncbi:telomere repeats-binding bouquet formation protein 1 [Heteronotia binoei]|uniref:telomere repeats-binding bouquet formation protein 1 n=1 Tax=Heteronotia binoei TaxID=13085 RepID=UPI002930F2E5|nr:telomere repeats-binding bouquet formation protein 1 [Heteronotia binoei]
MESARSRQCEMKTDLNLLLECLKYQMDQPTSQKEALVTIYSLCHQNSDASDYFREIGGLMFINNLVKSSVHSIVKESALFTLGGLAENNVFCQEILCTSGLFEDLCMFLTQKNSSVNLKRMSVYVLLVLVSNNKSGQTYVRESGCLDVLLQLFRTTLSVVSEVNLSDNAINQCYQLWSSVCSALCACVNNPQNEDNQKSCSLVFPYAKDCLLRCTEPEIVRPVCSFIGLTVANNSRLQQFFVSIGGLTVLDELLAKLIYNSSENSSSTKLAVGVTKTLDACIADNYAVGAAVARYNIVPNLLTLLSYNMMTSGEKFSIILTLGHCTDSCEENQYVLVKNNGLPLMIQALTESQDEELNKAATFVLQNCKHITEKLSVKLSEDSSNTEAVRHLEEDLQHREGIIEDYRAKAKQILCRIEQLENEHQEHEEKNQKRNTYEMFCNKFCEGHQNENHKLHQDNIRKQLYGTEQSHSNSRHLNEKVRRQIFTDGCNNISPEDVMQTTSRRLQVNASDQSSSRGMRCTKLNQSLLNLVSNQLIATKFINLSSKNDQLKPANQNPTNASFGHHNLLHSAHKMKTASTKEVHIKNKSTVFQSGKSDVQLSECLFKQPGFVGKSVRKQVTNTEPLKLSSSTSGSRTNHILTISMDSKVSELRCSGCVTTGRLLNSRNFCKILQSCQYLCDQHKVILHAEMKYKRNLKRSVIPGTDCSMNYNGNSDKIQKNKGEIQPSKSDLQAKHDTLAEEQTCLEDEGLGKNHTYSFDEDENNEIHLADVPITAFKRSKRRTRKDFTSEEINYLLEGVQKKGHHWNSILWGYPFQKGRTNVDLAKKYCKLQVLLLQIYFLLVIYVIVHVLHVMGIEKFNIVQLYWNFKNNLFILKAFIPFLK